MSKESWSPWTAVKDYLWAPKQTQEVEQTPCDPVTCSECPGGPLCCNATVDHRSESTDYDYSHNQMYRTRGHQRRYFLP